MRYEALMNWGRLVVVLATIVASLLLIFAPWQGETAQERPCVFREIRLGLDLCGGVELTLQAQMDPAKVKTPADREKVMDRVISILETRVNMLGLTEPQITKAGEARVSVQLPGTTKAEARQLVGSTGLLEFKKVVKESTEPPQTEELDEEVLQNFECSRPDLQEKCRWYVVKKEPMMMGDVLAKAEVQFNPQAGVGLSAIYIGLQFNEDGARQFRDVVLQLKPKQDQLAIVLDRVIYSAPTIEQGLYDEARRRPKIEQAIITGSFKGDEAKRLAAILSAGALPTELSIIQQNIVGASLGQDAIDKGIFASWIAGVAVLVSLVFYYRLSGFVAIFTQLLNMLVVVASMAVLKATLTMPGIAGLVLLIGMGVDSNVLIFERIREELRLGKVTRAAMDAGYSRAFATILDTHVTTLITGLILFIFGTGPIRGFATTLSLGIIINLFTVLIGTRLIFEFLKMRKVEQLSI